MESNETPKKRNKAPFIIVPVLLVAAFFGGRTFLHNMDYESTDNAQIETNAVPIVSRLAGFIDTVSVVDYGDVKEGQLLVSIDDREYILAVLQAETDLANAKADLANAQAQLNNSIANKQVTLANQDVQQTRLQKATDDLKRDEALFKDGAITQKQLDDTKNNWESTQKQLTANQKQVAFATSQVTTSEAQIRKAQAIVETRVAALDLAKLRLSYCNVFAPVNGQIGKRNLEIGQYVQPGQPLMTVVNKEKFWVVANFKETQIEKMKVGQETTIKLDGYPNVDIKGKISSLSLATGAKFSLLPPDNATGNFVKITQRVPVKIEIDDDVKYKDILRAGLSVEVEVNVK
ncbi:MAG TPA: HlyD family secretion protein [Cyclobacteriaceae bacterium]|jgi:membrane fusion protein (multidrug efflux system)|nr:HlyD family secretion protein [Cyclobacteriaceae bacterium]